MSRAARARVAAAGLLAVLAAAAWWVWIPGSAGPAPTSAARAADPAESLSQAAGTDVSAHADNPDSTLREANTQATAAAPPEARPATRTEAEFAVTTHGFRATPEQRAADLAAYLAAENLVALRDAWRTRAAKGDADAARSLQQLYHECLGVLFGQSTLSRDQADNPSGIPGWQPPDAPTRLAAQEIGRQRCDGILPQLTYKDALRIIARQLREASELAAELGHPDSYHGLPRERADWPGWAHPRTAALLADGTPQAAYAIDSELAWILAACELGYPCSAPTPFLRYWCVEFGQHCDGPGVIEYARGGASPRDWRRALAERDEILRLLRAGDHAALMLPPGQVRGGGG